MNAKILCSETGMTATTLTKDETIRLQAAEIERLRGIVADYESRTASPALSALRLNDEITRLKKEIERLREENKVLAETLLVKEMLPEIVYEEKEDKIKRLAAEIERLRDDRDSWAQQADDRVKDCEGFINDLLNDAMDWNRLRAGDYRALDPDHQDVFDTVASKDVENEKLRGEKKNLRLEMRSLLQVTVGTLTDVEIQRDYGMLGWSVVKRCEEMLDVE